MNRKNWFALLLAGILLLSGCQKQQEPQPVYDTAPELLSAQGLTVNGTKLSGFYSKDGIRYLKVAEYAAAFDESFTVTPGIGQHQACMGGGTYFYTGEKLQNAVDSTLTYDHSVYDGVDWYHPAEELLEGLNVLRDEEQNHTYYTVYPQADRIPTGVKVPTLMYHAVSDDCWGISSLFVSPSSMEEQLKYLTENGYTPILFEDLSNVDQIEKPVLLTFDDGYDDNYTQLFPLLKKYHVKATIFMIMGSVGKEHYLTEAQIKEMDASGLVSFQSHTVTHEFLSTRTAEQLEYELLQSKIQLARLTGKESFVLCYPTGKYSQASLEATEKYYQFGLLMSGPTYVTGDDPLTITRKYVSRSTSLESFKNMVN